MSSMKTKQRDIVLYPWAKKKWLEVFEYFIGGGYCPTYAKRKESSGYNDTGGARYHAYKKNLAEQTYRKESQETASPDGEKPG